MVVWPSVYGSNQVKNIGDAAYYVVPATIDEMTYVRSSFALNHADMNALQRLYHPMGNEYQDYLGQK